MRGYGVAGVSALGLAVLATIVLWTTRAEPTLAHCQVPCGIYDDAARITRLREDATTIAKAIKQINELAGKHEAQAFNQAARWVATKEDHATQVIEVVSTYFLAQKVKPVAPGADGYDAYLKKLADHHAVMVAAMKTKQTADPAAAEALHHAVDGLAKHYK
jgi:nickel superoxide dismutase